VPAHFDLRVGTLRGFVGAVASAHGLGVKEVARERFA